MEDSMGLESVINYFGSKWEQINRYLSGDFSNSTDEERARFSEQVRQICAVTAGLVAPQPIPIADIWIITPIQYTMVRAIGNIYGYKLDPSCLAEVMAVVGAGITGQQLCLALYKLGMPGLGGLFGAGFVFAWTQAIGHTAEAYFKSGMTMVKSELEKIREEEFKKAKDSYSQENS
ncbi:MAG: DUF697 domain-containing protein [Gloeomargarita sp. SKYBB_i_bin120]|nr:DUF697 domain-containing protein [Gloeomargarita sp. SKYB120]MDW8177466.1 DUF697 domain-containing protein [Gloeomargarita sp. SKYBB_i_bin120]